ncbi:MAG: DUF6438 domain-containing protein [Saprospiraceae bacterium]
MKNLLYLIFLTLFLSACNRKTATVITPPTVDVPTTPTEIEPTTPSDVAPIETLPQAILSIKKTPCYGKCPVFEARFMSDGRVTWFGKKHTERIGHYEAFVDKEMLQRLKQQIQNSQYFTLQPTYPTNKDKMITDLPQTITKVQLDRQVLEVTNNYDAPTALNDLERFVLNELNKLVWRKIE